MKKSLISLALLLLILPTAALAKGGHGGGHGSGHGGHGSHGSHGSSHHGSTGSKGSSSHGSTGSKGSSSHTSSYTSSHSVMSGSSRAAKSAARASAVGTPVHSWKSIANETTYQSSKASAASVPELYRGGSMTNQLLYASIFRPHYHSHVQSDKDWNDEQDKKENKFESMLYTALGGIGVIAMIATMIALAKREIF